MAKQNGKSYRSSTGEPPPHAPAPRDLPNLPTDIDSEKLILGSILLNDDNYDKVVEKLSAADFILEGHKRIFSAMDGVRKAGLKIDRITVFKELQKRGHEESVGGLTTLVSLDEGLPQIPHLDSYVKLVRDKGIQRRIIFTSAKYAKLIMGGMADTKEVLAGASAAFFDLQQQADSESKTVFSSEEIVATEGLEAVLRPWDHSPGIPTGFEKLDDKIYGLQPGNVIAIAAQTSGGKTALSGNIVLNLLKRGDGVLYFSSEMSKLSMLHRMAAACCGISYARFRRGWLKEEELRQFHQAIERVVEMPLYVDESAPLTIHEFESRCTRMVQAGKIKLAVLDYIQLMDLKSSGDGHTFRDEREALTHVSGRLVKLGKALQIPLVYLSQFSRAVRGREKSDRRPKLSDLFGACLPSDTNILTPSGRVAICDIKPGDLVYCVDAHQKMTIAPAAKTWATGIRSVFRVTTSTQKTIRATDNHPFLTSAGYRKLEDLRPGDLVACPFRLPRSGDPSASDLRRCRLLGYMVGDGSYRKHSGIYFTSSDRECIDEVCGIVREEFPEIEFRHRIYTGWREVSFSRVFSNGYGKPYGNPLREWLRSLGCVGQKDYTKRIPEFVFRCGHKGALEFLSGYLLSDGSLNTSRSKKIPAISFSTTSMGAARDTQLLLTLLGVASSINYSSRGPVSIKKAISNSVTVAGDRENQLRLLAPMRLVGRKEKRRASYVSLMQNPRNDTSPGLFSLPFEVSRHISALSVGRRNRGKRWHFERKLLRRSTALEWGGHLENQEIIDYACSDLLWEEILTIEPDGVEKTWDMEVPGFSNFNAEGFLVHNSALENNSHIVLALYREEFDKPSSPELKNTAELIILKNRNGERGTIYLGFNGGSMTFSEIEPPEPPPEPEKPAKKTKKSKETPPEHQDSLIAPPAEPTNT